MQLCTALSTSLLLLVLGSLHGGDAWSAWTMWNPPVGYVPSRLQLDRKPSWPPSSKFAPSYGAWRGADTKKLVDNSTVLAFASAVHDLRKENAALKEELHEATVSLYTANLQLELQTFWKKEFQDARWVGNNTLLVVYTLRM